MRCTARLGLRTPAEDVAVSADLAVVASGEDGISIFDIAQVSNPVLISILPLPGISHSVCIDDELILVANNAADGGLHSVDVSDPRNPLLLNSYQVGERCGDVERSGDFAFLSVAGIGLVVLDVSDPEQMRIVTSIEVDYSKYLTIAGDFVYLVCSWSLYAISIANPVVPVITGQIYIPGSLFMNRPTVGGGHVYLTVSTLGLLVYDISDPAHPQYLTTYDLDENEFSIGNYWPNCAAYLDNHVLVGTADGDITVDVTDPANPQMCGLFAHRRQTSSAVVSDNRAFTVTDGVLKGLIEYDLTNPCSPPPPPRVDTTGLPRDIAEDNGNLIVLESNIYNNALSIYTWNTELELPQLAGYMELPDYG